MPNHLQDPLLTYSKPVLTKEEQEVDDKMVSLQAESIVNTVAFPMVLKAALELGVIDTIAAAGNDVWLSPYEIARSLPTKPTNPEAPVLLDRMLRLLVSQSILKCRMLEGKENGRTGKMEMVYATEPVCKYFLKDSDGSGSLVSLFTLLHTEVFFKSWTNLKDVILEGRDAFSSAHGMQIFEYINSDRQFAEMFDRAMSEPSTMILKKVLEVYKGFKDVNTLVDVGGGNGTTLGLVTSKYPHIKGINFDLPPVLANAPSYPGVEHVSGDMFIEVPKGDAVFMKWILHDWTDELCMKLLKNCWKSLPENGKVIIVDLITPSEPKSGDFSSNYMFGMDMLMLTQCSGGKERSFLQLENLAFGSGFLRCEVVCGVHSYSVIEFQK
ncbi:O-methyltransferase family protein [Raphanus sativus]|uniref:Indole glucosinolate O-methyltransferase 1 n=1 Tax=Raphanus sativus TaxID=3726 RepID=A0A6J0MBG6_RAPSA|nr:indole glucosinolate O-methyltransferase 1 [Raphanus sativus]KAJ4909159.1 O-methyltransferase family protein [Raphanus sativus]